jgi:hypothetical protein
MGEMSKTRCRLNWCLAGAALSLLTVSGCQTWVAGMTLPSGHYLEHPPQFFPQSPDFPLPRELARQEETAVAAPIGGPVIGLPPQVPPAGVVPVAPVPP